jgi:hypothetical protein
MGDENVQKENKYVKLSKILCMHEEEAFPVHQFMDCVAQKGKKEI